MILELANWPLPWHETWLPINRGTAPAYCLGIGSLIGVVFHVIRPALRPLVLRLNLMILIGFLGAMIWSLTSGILNSHYAMQGVNASDRFDAPVYWLIAGGQQTAGLLAIFGIIWAVTSALWIAERWETKKQNKSQMATPRKPSD